jgi:hypothetical protein
MTWTRYGWDADDPECEPEDMAIVAEYVGPKK